MNLLKITILLLLSFAFVTVNAQEAKMPNTIDVIYLKDGSIFRGTIQEYIPKEKLIIKSLTGAILTFNGNKVKYVRQEILDDAGHIVSPRFKLKKEYAFKEKGKYFVFAASSLGGTSAWFNQEEIIVGASFSGIAGYQLNRFLGAGLGAGIDYYYVFAGETVYPLFVELRGYLQKKNVSPYYSVAGGYSFAFKNDNRDVISAVGGFMFHPTIGLRFGGSSNTNFLLDIGTKFQKASFTRRRNWGGPNDSIRQNMKYKRFTIRAGIIF